MIVPVYNEEKIIDKSLEKISNYMDKHFKNKYEIIVIDDCSTDKSYSKILSVKQPIGRKRNNKIRLYHNMTNQGKGYSVTRGLIKSEGIYFLVTDADLSTPISYIKKLMKYRFRYDMIIGSRYMKKSVIRKRQSIIRIFYSRMYNLLVKIMFNIDFNDTQCGFKLYNRISRNVILNYCNIKRFSFDIEHILLLKRHYLNIKEVPVSWCDNKPQRVTLKQIRNMFTDLLKIKKLERLGIYG